MHIFLQTLTALQNINQSTPLYPLRLFCSSIHAVPIVLGLLQNAAALL